MYKKIATGLVILILGLAAHIYFEVNFPKISRVELESEKIPKGESVKILQISDVHSNPKTRFILEALRKESPDIVVMTGDILDGKSKDIGHIYEFVQSVSDCSKRVFYVKGNHEWRNPYNEDFVENIRDMGICVLQNDNAVASAGKVMINVCGVDDFFTRHSDISKTMSGIDENLYTVLLSHAPDIVKLDETRKSDLVLSGHTHGGQIRLPIIGGIVAPGQGFFPKYQKGIYEIDKGTILYIDSGYGTSTLPIRILNRSQISIITIKGKG